MGSVRVEQERGGVEDFVRLHQRSVRRFLVFLGCPAAWLDDLVQDVFLSALASPFEDRGPRTSRAWLRRVARHLYLKKLQRERRVVELEELAGAEMAWVRLEGDDEGAGYLEALRQCVATLQGRAREVLELRYGRSHDRGSIARELGLKESGVKSILSRSKKLLRECIERRLNR